MQVEINNQESVLLPALGQLSIGSDEACDVVLNTENDGARKYCSVISEKAACILEVHENDHISINDIPIREFALLHAGDIVKINDHQLKLVNDDKQPENCQTPFKLAEKREPNKNFMTSVSGLRSFNKKSEGELSIVGDQNSFTHKPSKPEDIPFSVSFIDQKLTLLCKKGEQININGNNANYAILNNGDFITTQDSKFCVESPGTSAFSKYGTPDAPSETQDFANSDMIDISPKSNFLKKNLWWITLMAGLVIIAAILYYLKNMK